MLFIRNYVYASDLDEAYRLLITESGCTVLGGCGYLRLGARKITTAIDLSRLDLDYIRSGGGQVEIGAMTTLRQIETDPITGTLGGGVLPAALANIVGVQLRGVVTIGGTIAGRYPFSDPVTALLALDARVGLYHHGEIALKEYLSGKAIKDIVEKIIIPDDGRLAAFTSVRKSRTDYAVLNAAVAKKGDVYRVIVGARPGRAVHVPAAEALLSENGLNEKNISDAGELAAASVQFGDNPRGSAAYRKAVCPVLIRRALTEVMHAA